jgi:hypothetical protein
MVTSRYLNAGQNHNIKIDNKSFEIAEHFKYLGKHQLIKIPFMKKLRADGIQGMLAFIRCRIFCLPVQYKNIKIRYTAL